ncbi:MAG: hypothetical protein AN485_24395, partial [Anabaena sp. MDT14b]
MQGITTVVLGADGRGPYDVTKVLEASQAAGLGTNTYALVGFGTVRGKVMGNSSAPATAEQLAQMRALGSEERRGGTERGGRRARRTTKKRTTKHSRQPHGRC